MTTRIFDISVDALRSFCIRNNYFTAGDCDMYRKLFTASEEGASLDDLATMIWMCSTNVSRSEVLENLRQEAAWPISVTHLADTLQAGGWGETEIDIITEALRTHQDAGTAYRILGE